MQEDGAGQGSCGLGSLYVPQLAFATVCESLST